MADNDSPGATGIAAQHAAYPDTPRKIAPTDGSEKFNTLRAPLVPVACWL